MLVRANDMLLHDRPLPTLIPVCSGSRKEIVQLISIPWFVIRLHAHVAGKGDGGKGWCCLPAKGKASPPVVGGPVQSLSLSFFALFSPLSLLPPLGAARRLRTIKPRVRASKQIVSLGLYVFNVVCF